MRGFVFEEEIMKWTKKILGFICLLLLTSCMATPNIHVKSENTQMSVTQSAPIGGQAALSPDGKYLLIGVFKGGFRFWDISRGTMINKYEAGLVIVTDPNVLMNQMMSLGVGTVTKNMDSVPVAFTPDGKYFLSGGKELKVWDLASGKLIRIIGHEDAQRIAISSDGSRVLSLGYPRSGLIGFNSKMSLYDVNDGRKISEWSVESSHNPSVALSPGGKYALSKYRLNNFSTGKMALWDVSTGNVVHTYKGSYSSLQSLTTSFALSPDGQYALSGGNDGSVRLWDVFSGAELKTIKGHTRFVEAVAFSPNGRYILSGGGSDGLVKLWDRSTGSEIKTFSAGTKSAISYVAFSPDGKRIISMAGDASVRIFDVSTGEEIAMLIGFEDGEWLAITSEGYYNASAKGAQYLNVKFEGKDYTVNQFYDVFYRPDIVAAKLSGQDIKGLVSLTMKDASKNPPPIVEIVPLKDTDSPKAKVCYSAKSTGGGIGEIRLFHNGKLIQSDGFYKEIARSTSDKTQLASLDSKAIYNDMRSVSIKGKVDSVTVSSKSKGETFEDCKEIDAVPGDNEISVTAFNSTNTVQGYMKTINFNSNVKAEDPHLYILAIGIDQYKDKGVNLKYAVKDAKDLEEKIKTQSATLYKQENIHYSILTDQEATKTNITGKINELTQKIKPQDSFILFVAGHGVLLQNQYYMLTHDFNGEVSNTSMISSNEIVEMSKKIKSLSQLFIFDTCHAGGVDTIVSGLYDARMSVLAKKMGLHIYASANDKQSAMDGYKGNGLFTYTLLNGLNNNKEADKNKDGKVTVVGLGEYSKKMTTEISKEVGYSQTPLIINFGKDSPIYKLQ
jgi:WD40 repeat protein